MQEVSSKLSQYSDYIIFAVILFLMLFKNGITSELLNIKNIKVSELVDVLKDKEAVLVDVRTIPEYVQGHVKESINIPLNEVSSEKLDENGIKKDKTIYLICRSGNRSLTAAIKLKKQGYNVVNVKGGMTYWQLNKLPVAH